MIKEIELAAKDAFIDNQVPWLLCAITDWSYEEGSAPDFAAYTKLFEETGPPPAIVARMRLGINGWLHEAFEGNGLKVTDRKKSHGCDFTIQTIGGLTADVESKLSFDCTTPKYYAKEIPLDREKLLASCATHAFQLVYIVSLPNYDYPRGVWNVSRCKRREVNNLGQVSQWNAIRSRIPFDTEFPGGGPIVFPFEERAKVEANKYLEMFYDKVFRPSEPWTFDLHEHLRGASVGITLWQWR